MLFVIDKPKLQRLIAIARDDHTAELQRRLGPFFRLEASDGHLRLTGRQVAVDWPATVYEPGVLFLRITLFRKVLRLIREQKFITIQVTGEGLHVDDVRLPLVGNDMLLFTDPSRAPERHPDDVPVEPPSGPADSTPKVERGPSLFDGDEPQ